MIDVLETIALAIAAFFWDYIGFVVAFFVGTSTILLLGVYDYMRSRWLMPARDELERARKPLVEASTKARETNDWWVGNLSGITRAPQTRNYMLEEPQALARVTAADVQAFAAKYLHGTKPVVVIAKAK